MTGLLIKLHTPDVAVVCSPPMGSEELAVPGTMPDAQKAPNMQEDSKS